MAKNKGIAVLPDGDQWKVQRDGSQRPSRVTDTQAQAIEIAREQAKNGGLELRIHRPDGRIRSKDSYGNDPNPPKDQEH